MLYVKIGRRNRKRCATIYRKMGVIDLVRSAKILNWKWPGHLARLNHNCYAKTATVKGEMLTGERTK